MKMKMVIHTNKLTITRQVNILFVDCLSDCLNLCHIITSLQLVHQLMKTCVYTTRRFFCIYLSSQTTVLLRYPDRISKQGYIVVGNKVNSSIVDDHVVVVGLIYTSWTYFYDALHQISEGQSCNWGENQYWSPIVLSDSVFVSGVKHV